LSQLDDALEDDDELAAGRMTLWEHLRELRDRLIKTLIAISVGAVIGWVLYPQILDFLLDPYCHLDSAKRMQEFAGQDCALVIRAPMDGFIIRLKIAGYFGLFVSSPFVFYQLWAFLAPGLYEREKRYAIPFVGSAVVLFLGGAALAWWTLPKAFQWLFSVSGDQIQPLLEPVSYLSFVVLMMVAFGIGFLFPIVLVTLQLVHVLSPARLRAWRRYAIVAIVVIDAVITPSGDPFTLLMLAVPMVIFYELSIIVGRIVERRRARAAEAATAQ
jgi:sec-independent protein translocase protein TatC